MVMQVALRHRTSYRYDRLVGLRPQIVRLRPAPHCRTKVLSYSLSVLPKKHFINWQQDPFGNYLARLVFPDRTGELRVDVDLVAEMAALNPFDFFVEPTAENYPFAYEPELKKDLAPYLECERPGPLLVSRLAAVSRARVRTIDFLVGLNQSLQQEVGYIVRMEPGVQTCEETLAAALRLMPGFRLAPGADAAPSGPRRPLRLRLPDPAQARRAGAGRPIRRRAGLHRPARLDRGLSAGGGLDRARPDLRAARRRRPPALGLHARSEQCGADHRRRGPVRGRVRLRDERDAHPRAAARHQALCGARVAGDPGRRPGRRRATAGRRRALDHGRRADLRLDRRSRRRGMEHGGGGADQAGACRLADPPAAGALRAGRHAAIHPGQVVSGRAAAALGVRALLAGRWAAPLAQPRPRGRRRTGRPGPPWPTPSASCSA